MENYEYRGNQKAFAGVRQRAREDWTGVEDAQRGITVNASGRTRNGSPCRWKERQSSRLPSGQPNPVQCVQTPPPDDQSHRYVHNPADALRDPDRLPLD